MRDWLAPNEAGPGRWVVADTETSGLDPARDALLAIGAVAVDAAGICIDDSFEVVLRNEPVADAGNVLVHGIGHAEQRAGIPADEALRTFSEFVAESPLVGFHVDFDRAVLTRAFKAADAELPTIRWLDLARLAPALLPEAYRGGARSLDDWLEWFGIRTLSRHMAAGDALASAEILLRLRALAAQQGVRGFPALVRLSRQPRWLGGT
ncbi:MAG: 3'-5' exonuclease [Casimicrobiaceae bacterium]